jgi:hypothetical protein
MVDAASVGMRQGVGQLASKIKHAVDVRSPAKNFRGRWRLVRVHIVVGSRNPV